MASLVCVMSIKYPRDWNSCKWTHFHQRQEQAEWLIEVKSAKAFRSCGTSTYLWTYLYSPHNRQYGWNLLNRLSLLLPLLHVVGGRWLWVSMGIHSRKMDNVILGVPNILVIPHQSPFNSSHRLWSVEVGQTQLGFAVARVTTFNASTNNFNAHHRLEEVEGNKKFPSEDKGTFNCWQLFFYRPINCVCPQIH